MGAKGVKKFRQYRIIDLFDQAEKEHQLGADASDRTEPSEGGTQVQGITEQMEQEIELIVPCDGVLTRGGRVHSVEDACADGPHFWRGGTCARLRPPWQ